MTRAYRRLVRAALLFTMAVTVAGSAIGQESQGIGHVGRDGPRSFGPYNVEIPAGGDEIIKPTPKEHWWPVSHVVWDAPVAAAGPWSIYGWVQADTIPPGLTVLGGFLAGDEHASRALVLVDGKPGLMVGDQIIAGGSVVSAGTWSFLAASFQGGAVHVLLNGQEVASGKIAVAPGTILPNLFLAPRRGLPSGAVPYAGRLANFTALPRALSPAEIKTLAAQLPADPTLTAYQTGSPHWPVQVRQMWGQTAPQDPWTRPQSKAPFGTPVAIPAAETPPLRPAGSEGYAVGGWRLAEAPKVVEAGAAISRPGYDSKSWYVATVPGTVLTTLVDRGVYADPEYGLNNLTIPESLNKQDYWYRTEFEAPADMKGRSIVLTFKGINYRAEVWLNGESLGTIKGAFVRGTFDVSMIVKPGEKNALAVRIAPPPHPGLAHEESLTSGVGENGGMGGLDGPTFAAAEGWDWIPSVRDRNSGLWQDVMLKATGVVRLGDTQVVTTLPKADNSEADVEISVPLDNQGGAPVDVVLNAAFDTVVVSKTVTVAPGVSMVRLSTAEFPQLRVANPKLWWPNGYGAPALHGLRLSAVIGGTVSDEVRTRFGMRALTYEISLMDSTGHVRRVLLDPGKARALGQSVVDVRHEAIRKVAGGWVTSLVPGAESSPAVLPLEDTRLSPYLIIRVNGVRIAARGGSWGMDDWRKRVGRDRLEPYFRLHRDAHVNIIRNWIGQNTEETFYDLADEYGLLILNDFWESTQDYNLEAEDIPLFLANAADTIRHFRNHPSIALWFGRNEGVPQPILNEGLATLVSTLDGTRYYTGSSNRINLQDSGPYSYHEPADYFTTFNKGFAVEVGTPSFPTLEAFKAMVPEPDRWPISDVWAYHDWHQTGNGDVRGFMAALDTQFGAATGLEDFERKAQMLNYVSYRAIFEGMNSELWTRNSGRLLWMTQPSWPSSHWQMLSHDYDTHAAYYGVQKAAEPMHVQMNLPDHGLAVVNNTQAPMTGLKVLARVVSLSNRVLLERDLVVDAAANAVTAAGPLPVDGTKEDVVLVKLVLRDRDGRFLSDNFYWVARNDAATRRLNDLPAAPVVLSIASTQVEDEIEVKATLTNASLVPALMAKLTLQKADGSRILPAYFDANYVSLLPGDSKVVTLRYPAAAGDHAQLAIRGWNVVPSTVAFSASAATR